MSDSNPPEAPQDRPLSFFTAAIWALIALMVNVVVANMTEEARAGAAADQVSRAGCLALSYAVVFFGILRLHEPNASIRHVLALRPPSALAVLLGAVLGVALALPTDWLYKVLETSFPSPTDADDTAAAANAASTVGKAVGLFVSVGLVLPILTELFFRGVLFTPLRRTHRAEQVIVAVTVFESLAVAYDPRLALTLLVPTLVFSWMRGVTGSVVPSLVAHVAINLMSIVPTCLRRPDIEPTKMLLAISGIAGLVSLVAISLLSRSARAIDARQRDAGEVSL